MPSASLSVDALLALIERADFGEAKPSREEVLDFFEVHSGDAFDVPPETAIEFFKQRGLLATFGYGDMTAEAAAQALTVAKMMDIDLVKQVASSLESALANGQSFRDWADELEPMLQAAGWWGRKALKDPKTGQTIIAELGSSRRLETIFRTNMQTAYAVQHWKVIQAQKDVAPYLMYDAVDDGRTRPSHRHRDETILPADHPWWDVNTPPLGYNCRCGVIQLSTEEVESIGRRPNKQPPGIGTYEWKNPRTGETLTLLEGIDPGFGHNPGKFGLQATLDKAMSDKVAALPANLKNAVRRA